jgi:hypothetical protein
MVQFGSEEMATVMHGSIPGVYEAKIAIQVSSEKNPFAALPRLL